MHTQSVTEWRKVLEVPLLKQSEIHVWRINLDQTQAHARQLENYLSGDECDQADAFHFPHDRRRFVVRRGVLRHILASYLGSRPTSVQLLRPQHGKPTINGQSGTAGIRFSCSHSDDWSLIAINRGRELGVDLERHRPLVDLKDLAVACLSPDEIIELMKQPEALKTRRFIDAWTHKEAFVKAIGQGLSFPLKDVAASLALKQATEPSKVKNVSQAAEAWKSMSLDVRHDYSAALVYENQDVIVQYLEWNPDLIK